MLQDGYDVVHVPAGPACELPKDDLLRLPTYRVAVFAVTADDAVPDRVRLWWEPTDYVEIDVTR